MAREDRISADYMASESSDRIGVLQGIASKWEISKDRNREFKYYRLTSAGRKQLIAEQSKSRLLTDAIARIMWPAEES
jgi:DNA-binding PadR family transcriptional regulator